MAYDAKFCRYCGWHSTGCLCKIIFVLSSICIVVILFNLIRDYQEYKSNIESHKIEKHDVKTIENSKLSRAFHLCVGVENGSENGNKLCFYDQLKEFDSFIG